MILAREAGETILRHVAPMPVERAPLELALGSVLAEPVVATVTIPPWRNSSMDGYAVRAEDVQSCPVTLTVVEHVAAGHHPTRAIGKGEATKVMTGAPVPDGADSIIRIEDTDRNPTAVRILDNRDASKHIRPRGEDYNAGDTLLAQGEEITPAALGVLASAGVEEVLVYQRPTVAIVSSGDELVLLDEFDEVRAGRRIVSSNSYSLPALVQRAGAIPRDVGVAADNPASLREKIEEAHGCDLIITSAGISVGDQDYTRQVFESLGADLKFWKVKIRPGAPMAFGTIGLTPWVGLSGNPVSAMVTFELFVRPAIRKMLGHTKLFRQPIRVRLEEPINTAVPLTHFLRAMVTYDDDGYRARLTGTQSSAVLTSMTRANALLIVPYDRQHYAVGEYVSALPLSDDSWTTSFNPL